MARIMVRAGYDAVVERLLFRRTGVPRTHRSRADAARLERKDDPDVPIGSARRTIPDLGLTRPGAWTYSCTTSTGRCSTIPHLAGLNRPERAMIQGVPEILIEPVP
jgi:hypothetical protein